MSLIHALPVPLSTETRNGNTFVENIAVNDGINFRNNSVQLMDAWGEVGGNNHRFEKVPLSAHIHGLEISSSQIKTDVIVHYSPSGKMNIIGVHANKKPFNHHQKAIEVLAKSIKHPINSIVMGRDGKQVIVQYDIAMMDVFGEQVRHVIIVSHDIFRGAAVMLSALPLVCTNQLPVLNGSRKGGHKFNTISYMPISSVADATKNMINRGHEKMQGLYDRMRHTPISENGLEQVLRGVFPNPSMPNVDVENVGDDGEINVTEKWKVWHEKAKNQKALRDTTVEILRNATGTHDTVARRDVNGYSLMQAVAEIASHTPVKSMERYAAEWLGGKRHKMVAFAVQEILRYGQYGQVLPMKKNSNKN